MRTVVYIVWVLIPLVMLVLLLWDFVDNAVKRRRQKHFVQGVRQLFFVLVSIGICVVCDIYALDFLVTLPILEFVGREILLVLLLPAVLFLAASLLGPTAPILISEAPKLNRKKPAQKRE